MGVIIYYNIVLGVVLRCWGIGGVWVGVMVPTHPLYPHLPSPTLSTFTYLHLPLTVKRGDRVAQLILERIITPQVVEVEDLDATDRGAGGFGSTGVAAK